MYSIRGRIAGLCITLVALGAGYLAMDARENEIERGTTQFQEQVDRSIRDAQVNEDVAKSASDAIKQLQDSPASTGEAVDQLEQAQRELEKIDQ